MSYLFLFEDFAKFDSSSYLFSQMKHLMISTVAVGTIASVDLVNKKISNPPGSYEYLPHQNFIHNRNLILKTEISICSEPFRH